MPYLLEPQGFPTYDGRFVPDQNDFDRTVQIIAGGDSNKVIARSPLFGAYPGCVADPKTGMVFTTPG